jgi:hypothetical protein
MRSLQRIAGLIRSSLRLRVFVPLLAAALLATWYGLWPSLEHIKALTGGQRFVDMQPALTPAALIGQVRAYDRETVHFYLWWSAFDFAWPFLTFTSMLFITAWLFRFLPANRQGAFVWLVAAAYATVLIDWGENIGFVSVMLTADPQPLALAGLAVLLHRGKLFFNFIFNAGFFAVLTWAAVRSARNRQPGETRSAHRDPMP